MATIKDVAKLAGTSTATISRFINKSGYVNEATQKRIELAIKELNYKPNHYARSLSNNKTGLLALIIPDIRNPFFAELSRVIEHQARKENYNIINCNSDNDILKIRKTFIDLEQHVDGIMVVGAVTSYHVKELSKSKIPFIILDAYGEGGVSSVSTDNRYGGKLATLHLIEQGYNRVAHIRGPSEASTAIDRYNGYLDALKEKDITYDPVLIQFGDFQIESGYEAMIRFLALSHPPDGIFIANDLMAIGALEAVRQHNLKIPDDIGIVGYDNIPLTKVIAPKLTTIQQPIKQIGKKAVENMLLNIKNSNEEIKNELLPPEIIIRHTSQRL
ncbi:LacI family DNA-binding transcriptional regulator [Gracilibacillus alcaliphilus]|uniref:LacI family DNA-binding transcriptional regulator n=1 Tax=Gracilibacillus alcaliphilus TaxID=1401441 RepID=UPI00195D4853|nr:LacI family DNA-binding transcriptional regulator [Gracilibacillus alcaliphilus]MBM7677865.1 LacI family transcriptional regulator [Gracilibacillus alcaliphilus]